MREDGSGGLALEWLQANAKAYGVRKAVALPVSVPSHCSLMREAAEKQKGTE